MQITLATVAQVVIGKVSNRKNARWHLDILGRAHCGAGRGITAAATRWSVDGTIELASVCRRCLKALRVRLAEQPAGDAYASDAAYALAPAEQVAAREAELIPAIRAHVRAMRQLPPTPAEDAGLEPWEYARRLLAELRDEVPEQLLLAV